MRLAVLWQQLTDYTEACLRALQDQGHSLLIFDQDPSEEAPYHKQMGSAFTDRVRWSSVLDIEEGERVIRAFSPDVLLICSWHLPQYRALAKRFAGDLPRVLCMDNWWHATAKQWAGRLAAAAYIQPYFDLAFVPGTRHAQFAEKLGFEPSEIITGLNCADVQKFRRPSEITREPAFLFTGRLIAQKGVHELLTAYRDYRSRSSSPWTLRLAGAGSLAEEVGNVPGVEPLGFVQPENLPAVMWSASALILPSRLDHWGVVVQEAAAAGLPLCCTTRVAAADRFLQDGNNGYLIPARNPRALAQALVDLADLSSDRLDAMGQASVSLAWQFTPEIWAENLVFRLERSEVAARRLTPRRLALTLVGQHPARNVRR